MTVSLPSLEDAIMKGTKTKPKTSPKIKHNAKQKVEQNSKHKVKQRTVPKTVSKTVPLNIVFSYPVHWSKYKVLRDFAQNFYDAVTPERWAEAFHASFDNEQHLLSMEIEDDGFSYEWLLHIGASTKTDDDSIHAGYFGEGFKIASLCALRDFGWDITMSSRDWKLKVTKIRESIDGKTVNMLAYDIEAVEASNVSRLEIRNVTDKDYRIFQTLQDSFYYPENKLFGKKIWENESGAVYERSDVPISNELLVTEKHGRKGAVFCAYQMLGTNPFPLVFCLHEYEQKDRERKELYDFEVVDVILNIVSMMSPYTAVFVLEKMRLYWNSYPTKKKEIEVKGWSPVINALIRRLWWSTEAMELFRSNYPDLLCAARPRNMNDRNRRHQALAWAKLYKPNHMIVKNTFSVLGYPFLEDECERNGGFAQSMRLPYGYEEACYHILEDLIKDIFVGFFSFGDSWPSLQVVTNDYAVVKGMASLTEKREKEKNVIGLKIRYDLPKVHMKSSLFAESGFEDALSTYVHELCHVFGGDSSERFSHALTCAMQMLIGHEDEIKETRKKWIEVLKDTHEA